MSVTLVGTGLDNGLLPVWRQAIVIAGAGLSLIRPTGMIFKLLLMTMLFNICSANWQPSFVCACVLPPIFCLMPLVQVFDWYFWIATFFELGLACQEWEVDVALCGGLVSSRHKPLPELMLTPLGQKSDFYTPKLASAGLVGTWAAVMHSSRYSCGYYCGRRGRRVGLTFSGEQGRSDAVFSQPIAVGAGRY